MIKKSVLNHIFELRKRMWFIIVSIIICFFVTYIYYNQTIIILFKNINMQFYTFDITEGFISKIKISFINGIFLSIPVITYNIILFVFPALTKKERYLFFLLILIVFILFIGGLIFAYFKIVPLSIKFLTQKSLFPKNVSTLLNYKNFVKFIYTFLIGFGIAFEFPIVIIFLVKIKLIKRSFLIKNYRYVIVLSFIVAAFLTPPDWISQIMLAIPLMLLYTISLILCCVFKIGEK